MPFSGKLFIRRLWFVNSVVGLLFVGLLVHLFMLQVLESKHYVTMADDNRIRLSAVSPVRGAIYSRDGALLAYNRFSYQLKIHPADVQDARQILGDIQAMVKLTPQQQALLQKTLFDASVNPLSHVIKNNLDSVELAKLAVNNYRMKGVEIVRELGRYYPEQEVLSHVVGYLGRLDSGDLEGLDQKEHYRRYGHIGRIGVERVYDSFLHGKAGWEKIEVNSSGQKLRVLEAKESVPGKDLMLTIDADLQNFIYSAMGDRKGAVVALDPRNGEVLAMVSKPGFDPNQMMYGMNPKDYASLTNREDHPLFHRAVSGRYSPGSTVKPVVALAGLHHQLVTPQYELFAGPHFSIEGNERRFRDWKKNGHGWVNLRDSIAQSCDVFFYDLAYRIGIDRLGKAFSDFGLGKETGIDLMHKRMGLVPTRQWKKQTHQEPWYPEETVITGIGQGYLLVTPLQLAQMTAMIATRGTQFQPYLVRAQRFRKSNRQQLNEWRVRKPEVQTALKFRSSYWDSIIHGMIDAVHRPNGTAYGIGHDAPYVFAGKTGTVQLYGMEEDEEYDPNTIDESLHDHSLFIAFAPVDEPQIAIAVIVENSGSGSKVAAPIARQTLDFYFGVVRSAAAQTQKEQFPG